MTLRASPLKRGNGRGAAHHPQRLASLSEGNLFVKDARHVIRYARLARAVRRRSLLDDAVRLRCPHGHAHNHDRSTADRTGGAAVGSNSGKAVGAGLASLNSATGALPANGAEPEKAPEVKAHRHGCC